MSESKPSQKPRAGAVRSAAALGHVERETLAVVLSLRRELGREPTPGEVSSRIGLRDVRPYLETLERFGLLEPLTPKQGLCIAAIASLEARLGGSPSTREVADEMGVSQSTARFHIAGLVRRGLVTPPEVRLVLSVTPAGRVYVP